MPMRYYRAATGGVFGHIGRNLILWLVASAAIGAVTAFLNAQVRQNGIWGDISAFAWMLCGIFIMLLAQRRGPVPDLDDEADDAADDEA